MRADLLTEEIKEKIKLDMYKRAKEEKERCVPFLCKTKESAELLLNIVECHKFTIEDCYRYGEDCVIDIDYSSSYKDFYYGDIVWYIKNNIEVLDFDSYLSKMYDLYKEKGV